LEGEQKEPRGDGSGTKRNRKNLGEMAQAQKGKVEKLSNILKEKFILFEFFNA